MSRCAMYAGDRRSRLLDWIERKQAEIKALNPEPAKPDPSSPSTPPSDPPPDPEPRS